MNTALRTTYDLSPDRLELLQGCHDFFTDFGQVYALLRPRWHRTPRQAIDGIHMSHRRDDEERKKAITKDTITNPKIRPRRVWDLWSNRVVPIWMAGAEVQYHLDFIAVSHAWMDVSLRTNINTPINGYEWPVPVPIDTTLERVRMELLNTIAASPLSPSLVWLDVLCLRQGGVPKKEELRLEEWKLDVPTIGWIYRVSSRQVFCYYSGLGRPLEAGDLTSPRHWLNRAWTLQETTERWMIGGISPLSPPMDPRDPGYGTVNDVLRPLRERIMVMSHRNGVGCFALLDDMRHRSAETEIDKIAGLAYFFREPGKPLATYTQNQDPEVAWLHLISITHRYHLTQIFFHFSEPGNGNQVWVPSWKQINEALSLPIVPEDGLKFVADL